MREFININNVGNNNGEILNKFNWDLEFTPPGGLPYPGDQIFKTRLIDISGLPAELSYTIDDVEVAGGFHVTQIGEHERAPVTVTYNFQDYDDCKISNFVDNWGYMQVDPETRKSNPKYMMICNCIVYQLNVELDPVKKWTLKNGLLETGQFNDGDFSNKKEVNGKVSFAVKYEWWDFEYL